MKEGMNPCIIICTIYLLLKMNTVPFLCTYMIFQGPSSNAVCSILPLVPL